MNTPTIISNFKSAGQINPEDLHSVLEDGDEGERMKLYEFLKENKEHDFALTFFKILFEKRKKNKSDVADNDLMFGCYLLALHKVVEDALLLWEAKNIDMDAYGEMDVELLVPTGVQQTTDFLNQLNTGEAQKAIEFITDCEMCDDFIMLDDYYLKKPYYV